MSAMDDPSAAPFYSPQTITVVVGVNNTITWVNNDDSPHKVTVSDGSFNSGNLVPGASWTCTFNTPGTYAYHCSSHPRIEGTIIVLASAG